MGMTAKEAMDKIGAARARLLNRHEIPARVWIRAEDGGEMMAEMMQLRALTVFGMPVTFETNAPSRVIAESGSVEYLD
jgi:hypothetical protein